MTFSLHFYKFILFLIYTKLSVNGQNLLLRDYLNMTMVVVTHELASIERIADRIIFLDDGKVLFQGKFSDAKSSQIPAIHQFFNPA